MGDNQFHGNDVISSLKSRNQNKYLQRIESLAIVERDSILLLVEKPPQNPMRYTRIRVTMSPGAGVVVSVFSQCSCLFA